jgi:hypothetical protein
MPLVIEHNTREFKPVSAGTHVAVCTMIVNMGVQDDPKFGPRPKLYIRWEIPDENVMWIDRNGIEHSGPATIGRRYTKSTAAKADLRRDLEMWGGKSYTKSELRRFDVSVFLGKPCQLSVVHKEGLERVYANVAAVLAPPKGAKPKPSGKLVLFDADNWDDETFAELPAWLQQLINDRIVTAPVQRIAPEPEHSNEQGVVHGGSAVTAKPEFDDRIPF